MIEIVPAIIPDSYDDLVGHAMRVKNIVKRVQVDVLDGRYTNTPASWPYNRTDQDTFARIASQEEGLPYWQDVNYEIDMMVLKPEEKIDDWIGAGAVALVIHMESTNKLEDIFTRADAAGVAIGLALKPSTPNKILGPWIDHAAFVQCMGNDDIGRHGIELDMQVLNKIRDIRKHFDSVTIGVDIGVNEDTAKELIAAGATRLVSGSAIFSSDNIRETINYFSSIA